MKITAKILKDLRSASREKMERAFDIIYQEYSYLVYYLSLRVVRQNGVAQELTNETFLQLYSHRSNLSSDRNVKYYLTTTVKNLSINYTKHQKAEQPLDERLSYEPEFNDDFSDYVKKFEEFLNEEEIELVVLHLFYDFTFREIAKEQGTTTNAVSSKYKRVLDKLKKHYEEV